jgi:hypothetical protein
MAGLVCYFSPAHAHTVQVAGFWDAQKGEHYDKDLAFSDAGATRAW